MFICSMPQKLIYMDRQDNHLYFDKSRSIYLIFLEAAVLSLGFPPYVYPMLVRRPPPHLMKMEKEGLLLEQCQ